MNTFFAIAFATLYGLFIRVVFGFFNDLMDIMSLSFLVLTPVILGFLTILFWPKNKVTSYGKAFLMPWFTSLVILVITILFGIEGIICWLMIYPLFAIVAGFGGMIAYKLRLRKEAKNLQDPEMDIDSWGKNDAIKKSVVLLLLPTLFGIIEKDNTLVSKEMIITEEIEIAATPDLVWNQLMNINAITAEERSTNFSSVLGFPRHVETKIENNAIGGKRLAIYEKGLVFEETITQYEPEKLMVLDLNIDPSKIPAEVMDEHIVIGGKYVDIDEDTYTLEKLENGKCRLSLTSRFTINTPFNWYASIWSTYLMSDILQSELDLVKNRSEK